MKWSLETPHRAFIKGPSRRSRGHFAASKPPPILGGRVPTARTQPGDANYIRVLSSAAHLCATCTCESEAVSAPGRVALVVMLLASTFAVGYALIAIAPSQDFRNVPPINLDETRPTQRWTPTTTIDESRVSIVPPVVLDPFTIPHDPTTSPPSPAPAETVPSPPTTTPSWPPPPDDDSRDDDGGNDDGRDDDRRDDDD